MVYMLFDNPADAGTWHQLCRSNYSCLDYEENEVVRVLSVSE